MKFIYETPLDMFDDLERKELIRITGKGCKGCQENTCATPEIVIPNREELNKYIDSQIEKSEITIEKEGLKIFRELDNEGIRFKYAFVKYEEDMRTQHPEMFKRLLELGLIIKGLSNLLKEIYEDDSSDILNDIYEDDSSDILNDIYEDDSSDILNDIFGED